MIAVIEMEFKKATRPYKLVFCMKNHIKCVIAWRFRYDVHAGVNFDVFQFQNPHNKGNSEDSLVEI